ncbi:MAG: hypothetical protein NVSMB56_07270 [Pyrinomonadaceae bacterium]
MTRLSIFGIIVVAFILFVSIFAPLVARQDYGATNLRERLQPPSAAHWFGTDATGRDVFARVVYGARISLRVGIVVVLVSGVVGIVIGALASLLLLRRPRRVAA